MCSSQNYQVRVYCQHGYFEYGVPTAEAAMAHGEAIMAKQTYRRSIGDNTVEFLHVLKVKVIGPNLGSEYPDEFKRT